MNHAAVPAVAVRNVGWRVTLCGLGINLALGILYTWSVISKGVPDAWGWSNTDKSWPYAVACLVFCLVMVPAGRMQDRLGSRLTATIGGVLVGLGMMLASLTTTPLGYILGFGLLSGAGFGFGYAATTPPAVKWFPPARTGMIAGLVVSGFGLASVYTAPLTNALVGDFGLSRAVLFLGVGCLVIVTVLAQFLKAPPAGFVPEGTPRRPNDAGARKKEDYRPLEMLRTWQFYVLWFTYACGAGAGLMIISKLDKIATDQAGLSLGYLLVAVLAIGNGSGRIVAGILSDRFGRRATLCLCFVMQTIMILLLSRAVTGSPLANAAALALIAALIGANYGANLSLFPSLTKDYYGLKNFGVNYGLVFTAWGLGGFVLSLLMGRVYDVTKSFTYAYYSSAALLIVAAIVTLTVRPPHHTDHGAVEV